MNKIEEVARALAVLDGVHPDWSATGMGMPGPEDNEPGWKLFEEQARVAIQAMREPTEAMERAGLDQMTRDGYDRGEPIKTFTAMIDAILSEPSEAGIAAIGGDE